MLPLPTSIGRNIDNIFPGGIFIIRKICENYKEGQILDVGCGNGRIERLLGNLNINILGIDIDANEIRRAICLTKHKNVHFSCLDISDINDKEFHGILLIEVLEHVEEPLNMIKDIYRSCEMGGFFILTIPNGYSLKEILMELVCKIKKHSIISTKIVRWYRKFIGRDKIFNESPHIQHFSLKSIRSILSEAGFSIHEEVYSDVWSGLLWKFCPWMPIPSTIRKFERKITRYLPPYLLGDWGFLCQKKE